MTGNLLLFPERIEPVDYLRLIDDYGYIGDGVTMARGASAENGQDYLIKGPSLHESGAQFAANEWIVAELAEKLGLPILDHCIACRGSNLFFASSLMPERSFYPQANDNLIKMCSNVERVYDVVVLDTFICNTDRHEGNLIIRRHKPRGSNTEDYRLILNDHSHALCRPPVTPDRLQAHLGRSPRYFIKIPSLRNTIVEYHLLKAAIQRVQALSTATIRSVVRSTPEAFLSPDGLTYTERFLLQRQEELEAVFDSDLEFFDRLQGAA